MFESKKHYYYNCVFAIRIYYMLFEYLFVSGTNVCVQVLSLKGILLVTVLF